MYAYVLMICTHDHRMQFLFRNAVELSNFLLYRQTEQNGKQNIF